MLHDDCIGFQYANYVVTKQSIIGMSTHTQSLRRQSSYTKYKCKVIKHHRDWYLC